MYIFVGNDLLASWRILAYMVAVKVHCGCDYRHVSTLNRIVTCIPCPSGCMVLWLFAIDYTAHHRFGRHMLWYGVIVGHAINLVVIFVALHISLV